MNVEEILVKVLREMGSDGRCNPDGPCRCGIDNGRWTAEDLISILQHLPAKRGEDGLYRPMVVD